MTHNEVLRLEERITIGIDVGESHFHEFKVHANKTLQERRPRVT